MKIMHYINVVFFTITALLYVYEEFIAIALMLQIFLGIAQLVMASLLITNPQVLTQKTHKYLKIYWILAISILGFLTLMLLSSWSNKTLMVIFICIIPMCIAAYFVCITYKIQKS